MTPRLIGDVLKEKRNKVGLSVKYVSEYMTSKGYKASEKTVYGWESNFSMPNAEPLLALCELYGIKNVLDTFGYGKDDTPNIMHPPNQDPQKSLLEINPYSENELELVRSYRTLNQEGQEKAADYIADLVDTGKYKKHNKPEMGTQEEVELA